MKKRVTLSIDSEVYENFQKYCEENAIILSKKVELMMKSSIDTNALLANANDLREGENGKK